MQRVQKRMIQELVIACFIQALLIAPKHRASNIQFPEKRVWTGFPESRSFEWKTSRNLREIGGKLMDKVLATKGAFSFQAELLARVSCCFLPHEL